jgi:hypothetical protein
MFMFAFLWLTNIMFPVNSAGRGLLIFKNYGDMPAESCGAQNKPANAFVVAVDAAIMGDLAENITFRFLFDSPAFFVGFWVNAVPMHGGA